jgi:hypothetical protein
MRKATGNPQRKRTATRANTRKERLALEVENGKKIKELLAASK